MSQGQFHDDRTRFYVWSSGDPSVGIPGQQAEVLVWVADPEHLAFVRDAIGHAFEAIWDERVVVMTEAETAHAAEEW